MILVCRGAHRSFHQAVHHGSGSGQLELLGILIMVLGAVGSFLCGLWLLFIQFQSSVFWGILCIFLPPATLAWVVIHWDDGKHPFLYGVGCVGLLLAGSAISGVPLAFDLPKV